MASPVYIKPLLALIVMAVIVAIAVIVIRNGNDGSGPVQAAIQQLPQNIDVVLKKARFTEIQDGTVVWELAAEKAEYDKSGNIAYLAEIRMEFKPTQSHGAITVTADSGEYLNKEKNIHLKGHVHVVTEDGASFKTDTIKYEGTTPRFSTKDPVTFSQQRLQLTAVGMDLGVNDQRAHFYSPVSASIVVNR